jgi:hypothetical protein
MLTWLIATLALFTLLQSRLLVTAEPEQTFSDVKLDDGAMFLALIPVVALLAVAAISVTHPALATETPGIGLQ